MFIIDKNEINDDQEAAILSDGNVLLIACPGSGKTRALTYKIAYELSRLASPKKFIIAITYTNRAAEEIKERIQLLGVNTSQLWIGTIHSFCLEWILRPYFLYLPELKNNFRVINAQESEELLTKLCIPYKNLKVTHYDCAHIMTSSGYILTNCSYSKKDAVNEVLRQYWADLSENNQIDFELILYYSHKLITDKPFISKILSKIFSYFLIDEFQDTREIQYAIFSKILTAANGEIRAFIVGDPNQAIFTGLGGFPIHKNELERITGCIFRELKLSRNYRSSDIVIGYFNYFKTYENTVDGFGKVKDYPSLITYNTSIPRKGLEDEIVRLILFNIESKSISPNEICIVAPQWVHLASLTRNLMVRLPDYSFNGPGMAPFARDIDNIFFKLCRIALTEPSPMLYLSRLRWGLEFIHDLTHAGVDTTFLERKTLLRTCNAIQISDVDGISYLRKFFELLFTQIKVEFRSFNSLLEHYNSFFKSSEERIARLVKDGHQYISTTENFKKVFKQKDGITISTIHGVKGAEFDTVIAFALLQDYIPHFSDESPEETAKKLLYVISSRAKMNLHLISETGRHKPFGNPPEEYVPTEVLLNYQYKYGEC